MSLQVQPPEVSGSEVICDRFKHGASDSELAQEDATAGWPAQIGQEACLELMLGLTVQMCICRHPDPLGTLPWLHKVSLTNFKTAVFQLVGTAFMRLPGLCIYVI